MLKMLLLIMICVSSLIGGGVKIISADKVKVIVPKKLDRNSTRDEIYIYFTNVWNNHLSDAQKLSIFEKMIDGHKYGLSETFGSFHWRESNGGQSEVAINRDGSMDCGPYGGNTRTISKRLGLKHSKANAKMICTKLVKNKDFAEWNLMKEYEYWYNEYKGFESVYRSYRIWGAYNGGYDGNLFHANVINGMIRVLRDNYSVDEYDRLLKSTAFVPSKYVVEFEMKY